MVDRLFQNRPSVLRVMEALDRATEEVNQAMEALHRATEELNRAMEALDRSTIGNYMFIQKLVCYEHGTIERQLCALISPKVAPHSYLCGASLVGMSV